MNQEITSNIVQLINESYDRANKHADTAKASAEMAITEAQHCGRLLNKAKEIAGHGNWETWLGANCPDISQHTACRYMKLANLAHVIDFENCKSLTGAYQLAEILPQPEAKTSEPTPPKPDEGLLFLQRFCQYQNKHDLTKLNDVGRSVWRDRLKPVVELYVKLGGEL